MGEEPQRRHGKAACPRGGSQHPWKRVGLTDLLSEWVLENQAECQVSRAPRAAGPRGRGAFLTGWMKDGRDGHCQEVLSPQAVGGAARAALCTAAPASVIHHQLSLRDRMLLSGET